MGPILRAAQRMRTTKKTVALGRHRRYSGIAARTFFLAKVEAFWSELRDVGLKRADSYPPGPTWALVEISLRLPLGGPFVWGMVYTVGFHHTGGAELTRRPIIRSIPAQYEVKQPDRATWPARSVAAGATAPPAIYAAGRLGRD